MAMNTASLKASLSSYVQVFTKQPEASTDSVNHHNGMIRKVGTGVEEFETQEQGILRDRTRSDEGKATAVGQLATGASSTFAFLERVVARHDAERQEARAILFRVKPPAAAGTDPQVQFLYAKEIRDALRAKNAQARDQQQARDVEFIRACEASGVDLDDDAQAHQDASLWAMLTTPGGHGVTQAIFDRAMTERGKRLHPAAFASWQQAELLYDSLSTLRDSLVEWLRGLGGDPKKIHAVLGGPEPHAPQVVKRMVAA